MPLNVLLELNSLLCMISTNYQDHHCSKCMLIVESRLTALDTSVRDMVPKPKDLLSSTGLRGPAQVLMSSNPEENQSANLDTRCDSVPVKPFQKLGVVRLFGYTSSMTYDELEPA